MYDVHVARLLASNILLEKCRSVCPAEHLQHLEQVFQRLHDAGLQLKPTKCNFMYRREEYLDYVVTDQGISADQKEVEATVNFPILHNLKSLRSFTGLASYYTRFILDKPPNVTTWLIRRGNFNIIHIDHTATGQPYSMLRAKSDKPTTAAAF